MTENIQLIGNKNTTDSRNDRAAYMSTSQGSTEYNMNHKRRGLALLYIHENFDNGLLKRTGADEDCVGLEHAFKGLGFQVKAYWDSTINQTIERTKQAANEDHSDHDCIAIAISTHGDGGGYVNARNGAYKLDILFKFFTADQCRSLAGKPKLFFIQACRGKYADSGITLNKRPIESDGLGDDFNVSYRIPLHADFLIAYSTIPDFVSFRNQYGSRYIGALVDVLKKNASDDDILSMLTFVNQRIAIGFESYCPERPELDCKKQLPCFTSMLTRKLRFTNKA